MLTREREIAVTAVSEAAMLCLNIRTRLAPPEAVEKDDFSPVTIADYGSQALVCRRIREAFPDDTIVAEEDAAKLLDPEQASFLHKVTAQVRQIVSGATPDAVVRWIDAGGKQLARRYWTLDPIDGTKGFLRKEQYAVALALVEDGLVQVGVLACPALDWKTPAAGSGVLFVAVRSQGATMIDMASGSTQALRVASTGPGAQRMAESMEHGNRGLQEQIARTVGLNGPPIRMDSQAKYGLVARGDAGLYLRLPSPKTPDYREYIWDHAAGSLLVEEAGGRITDIDGRQLEFSDGHRMRSNRGVVVSNGILHDRVLAALAAMIR